MKLQEAFDKVWAHAGTMKERSRNAAVDKCAYRGDDGAKCFIGCLIEDDDIARSWDRRPPQSGIGSDIITLIFGNKDAAGLCEPHNNYVYCWGELQGLHDRSENWTPEGFNMACLVQFAKRHDLVCP